ncbi:hypothetical protein IKG29_00135 [Candidatus Saccharibacteria bacterium]|nr:hypothetical protein [Candidatus Saccharibacteria bacterium]
MILHKRKKFSFFAIVKTLAFVFSFVALGVSVVVFAETSDSYTTKLKITVVEADQDNSNNPPVGPVDTDPDKEDKSSKSGGKSAVTTPDTGVNTNDAAGAKKSRAFAFLALSFAFTILYFVVLKKKKAKLCFSSERNVSSKVTNLVVALLPVVATLLVCVSATENSKAFADINSSNTQINTTEQVEISVTKEGEVATKNGKVTLKTDAKTFKLYAYVKEVDKIKKGSAYINAISENGDISDGDVWGYKIGNNSFGGLPVITSSNKMGKKVLAQTLADGQNKQAEAEIVYGIKAKKLEVGSYEGTISYTVVTDMTENGFAERTSDRSVKANTANQQLEILTSLQEYGDMDLGVPEVKVGDASCQNASISKDSNTKFIKISCGLPSQNSGTYDIKVKIPNIDWEYTISNGIRYSENSSDDVDEIGIDDVWCNLYINDNTHALENSQCLQRVINKANRIALDGGVNSNGNHTQQIVELPNHAYYFAPIGHVGSGDSIEYYCILLKSFVRIVGGGNKKVVTDDIATANNFTVLYPYNKGDSEANGKPLDMFYYDYNFTSEEYLVNADFKNFVIDGRHSEISGDSENTAGRGKGFMINLAKNCDWENVAVMNMQGTGIGIDNPTGSTTIKDSLVVGCGRSGFGINMGYADEESITIRNSYAYHNGQYGFFFGHGARWNGGSDNYKANIINSESNFVVENSHSGLNLWDYGGERAYNVKFYNNISDEAETYKNYVSNNNLIREHAELPVLLKDLSTNIYLKDMNVAYTGFEGNRKNDVKWALSEGIVSSNDGWENPIVRGEALSMLWRYFNRTNETLGTSNMIIQDPIIEIYDKDGDHQKISDFNDKSNVTVSDKSSNADAYAATNWVLRRGVSDGAGYTDEGKTILKMNLNSSCDRISFVVFLYRLSGGTYSGDDAAAVAAAYNTVSGKFPDEAASIRDSSGGGEKIAALAWAVDKQIVLGTNDEGQESVRFNPDGEIKKIDAVSLMYRYNGKSISNKPITP